MASRSVQYVAKRDEVIVGPVVTSDGQHCAVLQRFGRAVTPFMLSVHQRRALNKGKAINITSAAISLAGRYCPVGGLQGSRRRKRRR